MKTLTLQLDWKPNAQFAGILVAHHRHWYARQGISLSILPGDMMANPVDALQQRGNIIVSADDQLLIKARAAGQPIKAIAAMLQFSAFGWLVLQSSTITTMDNLRGKRVGVHGDGQLALEIALAHFGMSRDDVEVIHLDFDYIEMLRNGKCDAIQGFVITEPFELEAAGLAVRALPAYEWSYRAYAQVLMASESLIADQADMLVQFLRITFDGWRLVLTNPEQAANIVATHYLTDSTPALELKILQALQPFLTGEVGINRLGWMDAERWAQSIGYLAALNLVNPNLSPEEVMTDQLITASYQ